MIGVQLIYNVVFVSGVQQSESLISVHIHFFFRFFSCIGHYRGLRRVPCLYNRFLLVIYLIYMRACVLICFSCVRLCDTMNCSPPGSSVHGILQARILEWAAMPSSRGSSRPRGRTHISYVSCIGKWDLYTSTTWEACFIYSSVHMSIQVSQLIPCYLILW